MRTECEQQLKLSEQEQTHNFHKDRRAWFICCLTFRFHLGSTEEWRSTNWGNRWKKHGVSKKRGHCLRVLNVKFRPQNVQGRGERSVQKVFFFFFTPTVLKTAAETVSKKGEGQILHHHEENTTAASSRTGDLKRVCDCTSFELWCDTNPNTQ